jgi:hypothetical protein
MGIAADGRLIVAGLAFVTAETGLAASIDSIRLAGSRSSSGRLWR